MKLGKLIGSSTPGLGTSPVDSSTAKTDNGGDRIPPGSIPSGPTGDTRPPVSGKSLGRTIVFILLGIIATALIIYGISRINPLQPAAWKGYEIEAGNPDEATVGQKIYRSNASGSKVYGQFGSTAASPFPAQPGYVIYQHINTPQVDQLYLKLRYSKNSPSSVPILIYIDDEPDPRASIHLLDQQNWDQFTWTEPILLGKIKSGVHAIKLFTVGQQYGVADLDQLVLSSQAP